MDGGASRWSQHHCTNSGVPPPVASRGPPSEATACCEDAFRCQVDRNPAAAAVQSSSSLRHQGVQGSCLLTARILPAHAESIHAAGRTLKQACLQARPKEHAVRAPCERKIEVVRPRAECVSGIVASREGGAEQQCFQCAQRMSPKPCGVFRAPPWAPELDHQGPFQAQRGAAIFAFRCHRGIGQLRSS